jgi:L-seryl-tRNA(Ser) seleniumtransferase
VEFRKRGQSCKKQDLTPIWSLELTRSREIPSIEQMRQRPAMLALEREFGHSQLVAALRAAAESVRQQVNSGDSLDDLPGRVERGAAERLRSQQAPSLRPVINATGVILHTNLGRAPLSKAAAEAVVRVATAYSNLEYDLGQGTRGRRDVHAERLLCSLTGAEASVVVNNNAAATLLTLAALAAGREVIVSRGELVEIGGGFRVPDVMQQSGALLREVGTTNRTRAADYAAAISDRTAVILRVHPSNFRITGFTERPRAEELVALGRRFNVPVVEDLGSGWLGPTSDGLRGEPPVAASIDAGMNLVMFSGDKLLGGPQAGIVAGRRAQIDIVRRHPLMRALRVDKMTYAALEATLQAYLTERSETVPAIMMIRTPLAELGSRADSLARALSDSGLDAVVIDGESTIGGGSAPGETLPTRLVELRHSSLSASALEEALRRLDPAVIARIQDDRVVLDLRTVFPEQDALLLTGLRQLPTPNSKLQT